MGLWRLNQRMLPFFGTATLAVLGYIAVQIIADHDRIGRMEGRVHTIEYALGMPTVDLKSMRTSKEAGKP